MFESLQIFHIDDQSELRNHDLEINQEEMPPGTMTINYRLIII